MNDSTVTIPYNEYCHNCLIGEGVVNTDEFHCVCTCHKKNTEIIQRIRKWIKGKQLTKEKLRHFLNEIEGK